MPPAPTTSRRRLALPLALFAAAGAAFLLLGGHAHALSDALTRVSSLDPGWAALSIGFELLSLSGYVALLALVAGRATPRIGARESAQITLAGAAATRVLPTAGAGGAALTLWTLRRAGLRPAAATRTLLAFLVVLYAVFLGALVLCGGALTVGLVDGHGPVALGAVPAAGALLAIALCLVLAARHGAEPVAPESIGGGRLRPRLNSGAALLGRATRDACRLVRGGDPRIAGALAYWMFDAAVLWAMLHALGAPPVLPVVVLAYFVGQVANTLPLPGSVSGGMTGVLVAFGVPAELALPAVLAYRAVSVWLPSPVALATLPAFRATLSRWAREDGAPACATAPARGRSRLLSLPIVRSRPGARRASRTVARSATA